MRATRGHRTSDGSSRRVLATVFATVFACTHASWLPLHLATRAHDPLGFANHVHLEEHRHGHHRHEHHRHGHTRHGALSPEDSTHGKPPHRQSSDDHDVEIVHGPTEKESAIQRDVRSGGVPEEFRAGSSSIHGHPLAGDALTRAEKPAWLFPAVAPHGMTLETPRPGIKSSELRVGRRRPRPRIHGPLPPRGPPGGLQAPAVRPGRIAG